MRTKHVIEDAKFEDLPASLGHSVGVHPSPRAHPILQLQQTLGNRTTSHLLGNSKVSPNTLLKSLTRRSFARPEQTTRDTPSEQHTDKGDVEQIIEQTETSAAPRATALNSGRPLPDEQRRFFSGALDQDLSRVRIHTGPTAALAARRLHARAFTFGQDVYFGTNRFQPSSWSGHRLLAHELVHTVQQGSALPYTPGTTPRLLPRWNPAERQARTATWLAATGQPVGRLARLQHHTLALDDESTSESESTNTPATPGYAWPWHYLLRPVYLRWKDGPRQGILHAPDELAVRQFNSLMNVWWSAIYSGVHDTDFTDELKKTEQITGVSDTWLNLVSVAFPLDLKPLLEDQMEAAWDDHPWWVVLYGLPVYSAFLGIGQAASDEGTWTFSTLLDLALNKFTESPRTFARAFSQGGQFTTLRPTSGFTFEWTPDKSLKLETGVNLGSILDWYPESDDEKKTYNGPELYLHFNMSHDLIPDSTAPVGSSYFGGLMGGSEGVYGFADAGFLLDQDETLADWYLRMGVMLRDLGPLADLRTSFETVGPSDGPNRYRINLVGNVNILDSSDWSLGIGGGVGALFPEGERPGAVDFTSALRLAYKPWGLGGDIGVTYQLQDLFDEESGRAWSLRSHLNLFNWINLSADYADRSGTGEFRFFLNVGTNAYQQRR